MAKQPYKQNPVTREWEGRAKNLLRAEIKRRGVSYSELALKLASRGIHETERNIINKVSRGGFTAAFLLQCLAAIGAESVSLLPWDEMAKRDEDSSEDMRPGD